MNLLFNITGRKNPEMIIIRKTPILCMAALFFIFEVCCSSSNSNLSSERNCSEPDNPYSEGSGHYAGFEWAERNNPSSCGANSTSFIEGCEEYQEQLAAYEECMRKK
jgi:hypothetical protein